MNTAPRAISNRPRRAFTLIELLVVIGIMLVLAGMVVMFAKRASDQKKMERVKTELKMWTSMIDVYHDKVGVYPPSNPNPNRLSLSPLFYELSGTFQDSADFEVLNSPADRINDNTAAAAFGLRSFVNAAPKGEEELVKHSSTITAGSVMVVAHSDWANAAIKFPRVPVDGPGPFWDGTLPLPAPTRTNLWYYNSVKPVHNPESYDFWAVYFIGGELRTNGNWK